MAVPAMLKLTSLVTVLKHSPQTEMGYSSIPNIEIEYQLGLLYKGRPRVPPQLLITIKHKNPPREKSIISNLLAHKWEEVQFL
jgi:hypothetical protein